MVVIDYKNGYKEKIALALGFFDCLHSGHKKLLEVAKATSNAHKTAVFTFYSGKSLSAEQQNVFTFSERLEILSRLGVEVAVVADFDEQFRNTSATEFLGELFSKFDISCVVCGDDYTFGKDRLGNAEFLRVNAKKRSVKFFCVSEVSANGKRVSTTLIKEYLSNGAIEKANELLSCNYYITGKVLQGRKIGRLLGFPTANMELPQDKFAPKCGVYLTHINIDGIVYKGISNLGGQPTFGLNKVFLETYLKDFSGDLYGRELKVEFDGFLRDTKTFEDGNALKRQLNEDLKKLI